MARQVNYYDYESGRTISCDCGWSGKSAEGNQEEYSELFDVSCPACDRMLLIVPYPTHEETRAAAAKGDNPEARLELAMVKQREAFHARAEEHELTEASQLPDLEGDELVIEWDLEDPNPDLSGPEGDAWTVLRHGDRVIWRELAFWEGYERFGEVLEILRARYGERLADLRPTEASWYPLYGDVLSSPGHVDRLRDSLRTDGQLGRDE